MATIRIFSGGAPKLVFRELTPALEQETGHRIDFVFAVTKVLNDRLVAGETPDVLVLPTNVLDGYQSEGLVRPQGRAVFALVSINAVMRAGSAKPDLTTVDSVKRALIASRSIALAPPGVTPSGTHMAKVIERLGLADALKGKLIHRPALEGGVELVVNGEADIGFFPKSEVVAFDGLTIVGPLPDDIQLTTIYGGAVTSRAAAAEAGAAFIAFMSSPARRATWTRGGFDLPK